MERTAPRWTTWLVLASLAIGALLLAQGVTRLVAGALLEVDPGALTGRAQVASRPAGTPTLTSRQSALAILRRNMFDSVSGPQDGTPVAQAAASDESEAASPPVEDPNNVPPCDGSIRLVATVAADDPQWSFAAITGPAGHAMLYRTGMQVEGREVVEIGWNEVRLRPSGGPLCALGMFRPPQSAQTASASNMTVRVDPGPGDVSPPSGGFSEAELDQHIQRVSDNEFHIDRSLVDRLLLNQAELMRTARILPYQEGGRTVGVKLFGIRRSGLLARIGLENGDVLRTINGFDMSSPDKALEAYARLRTSDHLTVSVSRRGAPMNIDYNIR